MTVLLVQTREVWAQPAQSHPQLPLVAPYKLLMRSRCEEAMLLSLPGLEAISEEVWHTFT